MTDILARQRQIIGTPADWNAYNLVLGAGELALERAGDGSIKARVGDGLLPFAAAPYLTAPATFISYQGTANPTAAPPAGAQPGYAYSASVAGVVAGSWGPPAAGKTVAVGDLLIMNDAHAWAIYPFAFAQFITRAELAAAAGASLVGTARGGSVQNAIDRAPVYLEQYGGGTGVADNKAAFIAALAALNTAGGGTLQLLAGTYNLASASLVPGIAVPNNVSIVGAGMDATIILVTGAAVATCVFDVGGKRNIQISDFTCRGNSAADNFANGSFIKGYLTNASTNNQRNHFYERLRLENFGGPYWIELEAQNTTGAFRISRVFINDLEAYSEAGNTPVPAWGTSTSYPMAVVRISGFTAASPITHVRIRDFYADCDFIKQGIGINGNVQDIVLERPTVDNAGRTSAGNDASAYALMAYDTTGIGLSGITINDAVITNPRSCGMYFAAAKQVTINNPTISGQTDTAAGTLNKGAIGAIVSTGFKIIGGRFTNNWRDVHIVTGNNPDLDIVIDGLTIRNSTASAISVFFQNAPTAGPCEGVKLVNCDFNATGTTATALAVQNTAANYYNQFRIEGGRFRGTNSGINLYVGSPTCAMTDLLIDGADIYGANQPFVLRNCSGRVTIRNCIIRGVAGSTINFDLQNCTDCDLSNIRSFQAATSFTLNGSTGPMRGMKSTHTTALANAGSLGLAIPVHVGKIGDFVQNLAPALSTYEGWIYTAAGAWKGCGAISA